MPEREGHTRRALRAPVCIVAQRHINELPWKQTCLSGIETKTDFQRSFS